jgi:hypothetical protein
MSRFKRLDGERLTVEIHKLDVVKQRCILNNETYKEYINRLIYQDMLKADEYLSIKYFKEKL